MSTVVIQKKTKLFALFPMQHCLNGVHINEVPKFLAESHIVTIPTLELTDPFDAAHSLIIPLQLSRVSSSFDQCSPNIAEYENEEIAKINLTAEEAPLDPSTNKYSERETHMLDHQGQISISSTVTRGPVYVSTVILY